MNDQTQVARAENPFGSERIAERKSEALVAVEQSRAVAEIQAAIMIAKQSPRNQIEAMDNILNACTRPTLAEKALYTYARGGTEITGPSIRLAEMLAQKWGNIKTSVRELEQRDGWSTVQTIAWDLETGYQSDKVFQVKHWRDTKQGGYDLKDSRDIYELTANQGARRLRACILAVIPGDVVEAAIRQCDITLKTKAEVTPERLQSLLEKFASFGVLQAHIEKRIQRRLESMLPAQMISLGKIFTSLSDGMSVATDWFEIEPKTVEDEGAKDKPATGTAALKEAAAKRQKAAPKAGAVVGDGASAVPAGATQVVTPEGDKGPRIGVNIPTPAEWFERCLKAATVEEVNDLQALIGAPYDDKTQAEMSGVAKDRIAVLES